MRSNVQTISNQVGTFFSRIENLLTSFGRNVQSNEQTRTKSEICQYIWRERVRDSSTLLDYMNLCCRPNLTKPCRRGHDHVRPAARRDFRVIHPPVLRVKPSRSSQGNEAAHSAVKRTSAAAPAQPPPATALTATTAQCRTPPSSPSPAGRSSSSWP